MPNLVYVSPEKLLYLLVSWVSYKVDSYTTWSEKGGRGGVHDMTMNDHEKKVLEIRPRGV